MTFPTRPRHGSPSSVPVVASHVHVRRFLRALEGDDEELIFGPYIGSVNDLVAPDPEVDGLLGPDGRPIERPEPPPKRPMGFHVRECE